MSIYTLKFPDEGKAGALCLEFDADDAAEALVLAHTKAAGIGTGKVAELWRGARKLCTIRRATLDPSERNRSARFQTA